MDLRGTLICIAFFIVNTESHKLRRDASIISSNICDPVQNNTNQVQCYCIADHMHPEVLKTADCYLVDAGVDSAHPNWNKFDELKTVNKLTLTNTRGFALTYVPTQALKHCHNAEKIDIKYANISNIAAYAFANITSVLEIILRDNQINTLDKFAFAHHKKLEVLSLDKNNIVEINRDVFVNLPALEKLYLTENKITTVHDRAFIHLKNLRELDLSKNNIFSLNIESFAGMKKLQNLDLSGNSLEVIGDNTFKSLAELQSLTLEENKIQMLDEKAFAGLVKLQSLSLARNNFTSINTINVFDGLVSLLSLSLRGNHIKELKSQVMAPILSNFYHANSNFDFDENDFPCDCRLDWFLSLLNRTESTQVKLSVENLKCNPSSEIRERWQKIVETENTEFVDEQNQGQNGEYEYYDASEATANGKLFFVDVRDLLNCTTKFFFKPEVSKVDKNGPPENSVQIPIIKPTTSSSTERKSVSIPEVIGIKKTNKPTYPGEISKSDSFTTTRLATVSAKPIDNKNSYDHMASDEAKPDKRLSHRKPEEFTDKPNLGNSANKNLGALNILLILLFVSFRI